MNYSRHHKNFAWNLKWSFRINEQDVLNYPANYLGPNYKEILNFWFYWDSLRCERYSVYSKRYHKLNYLTWVEATVSSKKLASEVIDPRFVVDLSFIVREIIASHLYLERNIPFTFLPLIFDL
jgi:hypothetical protein